MAYTPTNAKWYISELVEQIAVEGDPRNVVHKNLVLIRADSPEEAYQKALQLGREREISYENPAGKQVRFRFRGLSELNAISDELEHGAELLYEEKIGVSDEEIERYILPKDQLNVFRPIEQNRAPDYSSGEIMEELRHLLGESTK